MNIYSKLVPGKFISPPAVSLDHSVSRGGSEERFGYSSQIKFPSFHFFNPRAGFDLHARSGVRKRLFINTDGISHDRV